MNEYVHSTQKPSIPAKIKRGIAPRLKPNLALLPVMFLDLVYKFQIICLRGT